MGKQIPLADFDLKLVPFPRFLSEHRRVDKAEGVSLDRKLIDTVADSRQLSHHFIELWVGLLAQAVSFYHFSEEGFF